MSGMSKHVIIAGFGRVGQLIAQMLSERLIPFVALDVSAGRVMVRAPPAKCRPGLPDGHSGPCGCHPGCENGCPPQSPATQRHVASSTLLDLAPAPSLPLSPFQDGKALDLPVYFGDAGSPAVLHSLGADRALCAVITLDTPGANYRSVYAMHKHFPNIKTFVRAFDVENGGYCLRGWVLLRYCLGALGSSLAAPWRHAHRRFPNICSLFSARDCRWGARTPYACPRSPQTPRRATPPAPWRSPQA